jgi:Tol biopolymer transport system component/predicted Ser/Thr protein kinase
MPLSAGTRLGPYEILSPIGVGGMGEVYRARDTRLDRTVAIKVLPEHLSSNPQLRERFDREAKAISSLSHPHICPLYDVGHQDGVDFLVMEYLEGETLAHRLRKGALAPEQVLQYAIQITDALDTAHKHGVIHRDLKPGNIMLVKTGAKLLDFGLAKMRSAEAAAGMTGALTQTTPLTGEGTIVGTLQYMAPEQLEGADADARTDLFALGSVIYEMATGRKAFEGKSQASVISAIMKADPAPISTLQPLAPAALDHVVQTCLAKDPDTRWQTAHDVLVELKWTAEAGSQPGAAPVALGKKRSRLPWIVTATACAIAIALAASRAREKPAEVQTARLLIQPPRGVTLGSEDYPVVSPDGQFLVFGGTRANETKALWVRRLDSLSSQRLAGTEDGLYPFWSPDSRWIGFFAGGKLKKIQALGGPVEVLCDAPANPEGGAWSPNGLILFTGGLDNSLWSIPDQGGEARRAWAADRSRQGNSQVWPHFLPDGNHFLYLSRGSVLLGSLGSVETASIPVGASNVMYSPPGFLIYSRGQNVVAQPFDLSKGRLTGGPTTIAEHVKAMALSAGLEFSVSRNGVVAYRQSSNALQLAWYGRDGKRLSSIGEPGNYGEIMLSPDGKRLALERIVTDGEPTDIWILGLESGIFSRITFDPALDDNPVWSPDGRELIFASTRKGAFDLYRKVIGGGPDQLIFASNNQKWPHLWLKDGKSILFTDGKSFYRLPLEGKREPTTLLESQFANDLPRVSPDERWVAYQSNESGRWEIDLATFPAFADKRQISVNGGCQPIWRKDGKELFFLTPDGKLMAADVKAPHVGVPHALFQIPSTVVPVNVEYAVSGDGKKFLLREPVDDNNDSIGVVLNWAAGLKR